MEHVIAQTRHYVPKTIAEAKAKELGTDNLTTAAEAWIDGLVATEIDKLGVEGADDVGSADTPKTPSTKKGRRK